MKEEGVINPIYYQKHQGNDFGKQEPNTAPEFIILMNKLSNCLEEYARLNRNLDGKLSRLISSNKRLPEKKSNDPEKGVSDMNPVIDNLEYYLKAFDSYNSMFNSLMIEFDKLV